MTQTLPILLLEPVVRHTPLLLQHKQTLLRELLLSIQTLPVAREARPLLIYELPLPPLRQTLLLRPSPVRTLPFNSILLVTL